MTNTENVETQDCEKQIAASANHRIIESLKVKKTIKIAYSNQHPILKMTTDHIPPASHPHGS